MGLQKQVKSLTNKVKEVENITSSNKSEIGKINQKVAQLDNLQEIIAAEVNKQVSEKMSHLQKSMEETKTEVQELKKDTDSSAKEAQQIPPPKIDMAFRMGTAGGKIPRPILITFSDLEQRFKSGTTRVN